MKRFLALLALISLPVLFSFQAPATPAGDTNARIKSVFIYNFTRYIEWPADYKSGNFIINMFGTNAAMLSELNNMAKTKTVGTQKIEIHNTTTLDGIGKCNILYVTPDEATPLTDIIARLKGKSTLLVTEKPGLAKQGSAINFVIVDNRQKFELNQSNAEKYNLTVSSALVALAIPVQ
ncbi:MAG TPA: YfiR family protein [Bacteroidia bacterium]|nr:YfiR family protein [Bacteroidia bacterium]